MIHYHLFASKMLQSTIKNWCKKEILKYITSTCTWFHSWAKLLFPHENFSAEQIFMSRVTRQADGEENT